MLNTNKLVKLLGSILITSAILTGCGTTADAPLFSLPTQDQIQQGAESLNLFGLKESEEGAQNPEGRPPQKGQKMQGGEQGMQNPEGRPPREGMKNGEEGQCKEGKGGHLEALAIDNPELLAELEALKDLDPEERKAQMDALKEQYPELENLKPPKHDGEKMGGKGKMPPTPPGEGGENGERPAKGEFNLPPQISQAVNSFFEANPQVKEQLEQIREMSPEERKAQIDALIAQYPDLQNFLPKPPAPPQGEAPKSEE